MKLRLHILKSGKVSLDELVHLAVILFLCNSPITLLLRGIMGKVGFSKYGNEVTAVLVYLPLLVACLMRPKKYFKADFLCVWVFIVAFFAVTLLIHPEYEYWYTRSDYGVWNYVLFPLKGLYGYLFIRLIDEPQTLKDVFRKAGWVMYIYFAYQIYFAIRRGYWVGVAGHDSTAEFSYSVSFGYHVLLFALPFLYNAIREKRKSDIVGAAIGFGMILTNGSRGPVLMTALFFVILALRSVRGEKNKAKVVLRVFIVAPLVLTAVLLYNILNNYLVALLSAWSVKSRIVQMLLAGRLSYDSGRSIIWGAAVQMIRANPFGYGAMGSQHVISNYIIAGYPHSIVLEMMIDFGVIVGGALLIFLFRRAMAIIFARDNGWSDLFIPIFCTACALMVSLCYWSNRAFWICIGIGVNYYISQKKQKRGQIIYGQLENR